MTECKFHVQENYKNCKFCRKWRQTYRYFKKKRRSNLNLYCVKLLHYRTHEWFWKLGLTSQTLEKRFDETMERFHVTVEWEVSLPMKQAVTKETNLLYYYQVLQGRKYIPKARLKGYTECIK